jgi:type II secretory pathway component PulF
MFQPSAVTLEQLTALNDEIAALARGGVPLERGLLALGGDVPGGLGDAISGLAKDMDRGQTLAEALASPSRGIPPVYRAVVEAGMRTGRLAGALESLASSLRRVADTRRAVAAAMLYPLIVLLAAWGLFVFFVVVLVPRAWPLLRDSGFKDNAMIAWVVRAGDSAWIWGPIVPVVVLLLVVFWWRRSSQASLVESRWSRLLLGWLPWIGHMLRATRTATFVDILALMIENEAPLDQAVVLAAEASGDRQTLHAARLLAERLRQGQSLDAATLAAAAFPPLLGWLIASGQRRGALLPALRHASETYHRRARHSADMARLFVPVLLTCGIGGAAVLLYALMVFLPYISLLKILGNP